MSAVGTPGVRHLAQYHHCEISDRSMCIYLHAAMIDRLQAEILAGLESPAGAHETGGILLGYTEANADKTCTFIEDFVPVPCSYTAGPLYSLSEPDTLQFEAALLRAALQACDSGAPPVLGYYRSHSRNGLALATGDLALIEDYFTEPSSVFMLVKAAIGAKGYTAGFFFRHNSRVQSEFSSLEVPLRPVPADSGAPAAQPGALPEEPLPVPRSPWTGVLVRLAVIVFSTVALVASAIRYLGAPRPVHQDVAAFSIPAGLLGLQVETKSTGLLVTWNQRAPEVARALRGVLSIADGHAQESLDLDRSQLATGSVLYTPTSDDIQFRLEVYDASQRPAVQSVRVLRAPGAHPAAL